MSKAAIKKTPIDRDRLRGVEEQVVQVRAKTGSAVGAVEGNNINYVMSRWSTLEALQIQNRDPSAIKKYYYCTDPLVERFTRQDSKAKSFVDAAKGTKRQITHAWTYIEFDGDKGKDLLTTYAQKPDDELQARLANVGSNTARFVIARGLVVMDAGSNTKSGVPYFGELALGLWTKRASATEFLYLKGATLKLESQDRFYVSSTLPETAWVSRALGARFSGEGVISVDGTM